MDITERLSAGVPAAVLVATGVVLTGGAAQAATAQDMFSYADGWRVDHHPWQLADVFADGHSDIVGFGDDGTYVGRGLDGGGFAGPFVGVADYGYAQGWRVGQNPRELIDVFGHVSPEIVGFGQDGVHASYGERFGGFGRSATYVETLRDIPF